MKKLKSLDGKHVYSIKRDIEELYLANKDNYKSEIDNLITGLEDLKFNSFIIIFGLDTGEYLNELEKNICDKNRVIIFEPNKDIYEENKLINIVHNQIKLVLFEENTVKKVLSSIITPLNFDNLYVHFFGNYEDVYSEEAKLLTEVIDKLYIDALSFISLSNRFKEFFVRNLVWNLEAINNSTAIDKIEGAFKDIPAIIVSAGPSLEENIVSLCNNRKALDNYLIIAGSRTLKALINNGITPDLIVTIDPVDENYDMMSDDLESDIPLAFYEYSNRKIVSNYKGEKIYLSSVLKRVVGDLNSLKTIYLGGSVAHTAVDVARLLGCNPIVLAGQDLAFTNDKHHAKEATFDFDKEINPLNCKAVEDVNGKYILTDDTLNGFRETLEEYIKDDKEKNNIEYINVSYGAKIKGTIHKELDDILKVKLENNKPEFKSLCVKGMKIDRDGIIKEINEFIKDNIKEAQYGKDKCEKIKGCSEEKSLLNIEDDDEDFIQFLECFKKIMYFESSKKNIYIGGYFNNFTSNIKREKFRMDVKDYDRLTSNMKYQGSCLFDYFVEMEKMLKAVEKIIDEEVANLKNNHKLNYK